MSNVNVTGLEFGMLHFKVYVTANNISGALAMKKFTPSLGIPYLGV